MFIIISGSKHNLIAHKHGLQIGCEIHQFEWWTKENIEELGSSEEYDKEQIEEYTRYIDFAKKTFVEDNNKK